MSTHTSTPWIYSIQTNGKKSTIFCQSEPAAIGTVSSPEDAAHIVKCVNAHDKLVEANDELRANLRQLLDYMLHTYKHNPDAPMVRAARAALAKVQS